MLLEAGARRNDLMRDHRRLGDFVVFFEQDRGEVVEGLFRQATVYKGRNRDTAWFSVIDSEWPGLCRAFEGWLDPANFAPDGRQRASLVSLRG